MKSLPLYFSYASYMVSSSMKERIRGAQDLGIATLLGYQVLFNKDGRDSGKANLVKAPGWTTWGVLYQLKEADLEILDSFEDGYEREHLAVYHKGQECMAFTFISDQLTERKPTKDYVQFIVDGAKEHNLPPNYIEYLEAFLF